jgi:DNA-binding beta-propeller fold protein YncE
MLGRFGAGDGEFNNPTGIAVTADAIYVADRDNHRIQKFTRQGAFLWKVGAQGSGNEQLNMPHGLAVYNNNLYVADRDNQRVAVFNATNGAWVKSIGVGGTDVNQLLAPTAVAFDAIGKMFVSDRANKRVQVYERNEEPFRMVGSGGGKPEEFGAFGAGGAVVDTKDSVYASDTSNDRVMMFDFSGKFVKAFGGTGNGPGKLQVPLGVTVDRNGRILVADSGNKRIAIFNPDGSFVENKTSPNLDTPAYVTVSPDGVIYVTDTKNHRVVVVR